MSIYGTVLSLADDEHEDGCAIWVEVEPGCFEHSGKPCSCGIPRAPIVYEGSHVLPANTDRRGGEVQVATIPDFITRDGRDDAPEGTLKEKCTRCGKRRPPKTRPAHMSALDLPFEFYEQINGGPNCGVCGRPPKPGKRHHRDHDHSGVGFARGLACFRCNAALRTYMTLDWLRKAVAYFERAEARRPR